MDKLQGKIALITGAGSGIGRASAILFAQEGAKVAVVDYSSTGGRETVKMVTEAEGQAIFIEADVSRADDAERMVTTATDAFGGVDILVNNASIQGPIGPLVELADSDWDSIINIDLKGVFLGSKRVIPLMLSRGGGTIVNISSAAAINANPLCPAYCAAKAGVIQLTKCMALELGPRNIRVNCVCPGATHTPMGELWMPTDAKARETFIREALGGRLIQPREIAQAVLYLASDDASSVTGSVLVVDRGLTAGIQGSRGK